MSARAVPPSAAPADERLRLHSAAEIYPSPGVVESEDGEELRLYYGGMAYTHDENGLPLPGRHNSGVGMASLRLDGTCSSSLCVFSP